MNPQRATRQAEGNFASSKSHHAMHCGAGQGKSEVQSPDAGAELAAKVRKDHKEMRDDPFLCGL